MNDVRVSLVLGTIMILFGLAGIGLVARGKVRRWVAAQALMFGELGIMWILIAILSGPARIVVTGVLGLGVLHSAVLLFRTLRDENRELDAKTLAELDKAADVELHGALEGGSLPAGDSQRGSPTSKVGESDRPVGRPL